MKYLKIIMTVLALVTVLSVSSAAADGANGSITLPSNGIVADSFVGSACSALTSVSNTNCSSGATSFKGIARNVVNILSFIIGIVAVIMIIISGFRFIIGGNDTNAVSSAKNTLIYALVGLAIAVFAQFLVHSVLNTSNTIQQNARGFIETSAPTRRTS